jgi:hypothetical protein
MSVRATAPAVVSDVAVELEQGSPMVATVSSVVIRRGDARSAAARLNDEEEERRLHLEEMHMRLQYENRVTRARGCGGCAGGRRMPSNSRVYSRDYDVENDEYSPVDTSAVPNKLQYGHVLSAVERK